MKRRTFLQVAIGGLSAFAVGVGLRRKALSLYLVSDSENTHVIAWSEADAIEVMKDEFWLDDEDLEQISSVCKVDNREILTIGFESGYDYRRPEFETGRIDVYGECEEDDRIEVAKQASDWIYYGRGVLCSTAW